MEINQLLVKFSVRFWIVSTREAMQEVEKGCNECKIKAKSSQQIMAALPTLRFKVLLLAFTKIGVNFAGGFGYKARTREETKQRYLCLCMLSLVSSTFRNDIWYRHKFIPQCVLQNGKLKKIDI